MGALGALGVGMAVGLVFLLLSRTGGFAEGQWAACTDPRGDVLEVYGNEAEVLRGAQPRVQSFATDAPDFDIRVIELEVANQELLVRVALEGDWRRSDMFAGFMQYAHVGLIKDGGPEYFVVLDVDEGVRLSKHQPGGLAQGLPDKLLEGGTIGHERNVLEGRLPLGYIADLGGEFAFWGFVQGIVGGRTVQDTCASKEEPIAFPAHDRSSRTAVPRGQGSAESTPLSSPQAESGIASCPVAPTERIGGEEAATCLYHAWTINDRELAEAYASHSAIVTLFEMTYTPPGATFEGCRDGEPATCEFYFEAEPHGVLMVFSLGGGPSEGNYVQSVEFVG